MPKDFQRFKREPLDVELDRLHGLTSLLTTLVGVTTVLNGQNLLQHDLKIHESIENTLIRMENIAERIEASAPPEEVDVTDSSVRLKKDGTPAKKPGPHSKTNGTSTHPSA